MPRERPNTLDSSGRRHLRQHIAALWPSQAAFAREAGIDQQLLTYVLGGSQKPNLKHAVAIELASEAKDDPVGPASGFGRLSIERGR